MVLAERSTSWVFGYGSLLARPAGNLAPTPAVLRGFRRCWDVAMDNGERIPGYKAFVDPESGEQPPVFVTFLDVRADPDAWINGVLMSVPTSELGSLDARERNYDRHDVTAHVDADVDGRIWAYVGSAAGRQRYMTGQAGGTAVVSAEYLAHVEAGFASFGDRMLEEFRLTTDPPDVPIATLTKVDLAPA